MLRVYAMLYAMLHEGARQPSVIRYHVRAIVVHLVAVQPDVELENSRLLATDLDAPG